MTCPNCDSETVRCGACGDELEPLMTSRPALDREAIYDVLATVAGNAQTAVRAAAPFDLAWGVESVMALAVPVPTEEAIAEALVTSARDVWPSTPAWADMANSGRGSYYRSARAVLALFNGSES